MKRNRVHYGMTDRLPHAARIVFACAYAMFALDAVAASRTFVSSSGNDGNPCSVVQPCRSFQAAVNQANDGAEVVALDSAGYGTLVIDRSITISAPDGVHAAITIPTAGTAITFTGGLNYALRGLVISGGGTGVDYGRGGNLHIDRCTFSTLESGVLLNDGNVTITDSVFRGNTTAITNHGAVLLSISRVHIQATVGLVVAPTVSTGSFGSVVDSVFEANGVHLATGSGHSRFSIERSMLRDALITFHGTGTGTLDAVVATSAVIGGTGIYAAAADSAKIKLTVSDSRISTEGDGITAADGATVFTARNTIVSNNGFGLKQSGTGLLYSQQNNLVQDNNGGAAQTFGTILPVGGT
jgi:hypothetical protein